jgi:hypothetical protein
MCAASELGIDQVMAMREALGLLGAANPQPGGIRDTRAGGRLTISRVAGQTGVSQSGSTNGTYHAAATLKERTRRTRLLVAVGGLLSALALFNVVSINADMARLEQSGPERLALAGGGLAHFIPSILANLQRAQQPANTVSAALADDPRRSPQYIDDKRALERWMAVLGVTLAMLFIGLESRIPSSTAHRRSSTGSDLARLLILVSLAYGSLSIFESG